MCRLFELFIEPIGSIGSIAEIGAGYGSAIDREMDTGVVKFGANNAMFDIVEVIGGLLNLNEFEVPNRVDKRDAVFNIPNAGHRIMIGYPSKAGQIRG